MRRGLPWVFTIILALASTGCLSQSSLDGFKLPTEAHRPEVTFEVEHQPADGRNLNRTIASALRARGFKIVPDNAKNPTYVVSYIDRWYWDMRTYLIDLRIDVRDAKTGVLVATARSYQTSLAAMGETHESIINRTVDVLVEGMGARLQEQAAKAQDRQQQRKR